MWTKTPLPSWLRVPNHATRGQTFSSLASSSRTTLVDQHLRSHCTPMRKRGLVRELLARELKVCPLVAWFGTRSQLGNGVFVHIYTQAIGYHYQFAEASR